MATVYVLGAGSSVGIHGGMPSMDALNRKVGELVWNSSKGIFPNIKRFVLTSLPHIANVSQFQLEIVLTELDSLANNKKRLGSYTKSQIQDLRAYLLFAINEAMSQALDQYGMSVEEAFEAYMNYLVPFLNSLQTEDAIISMNYDTILDGRIGYSLFHGDIWYEHPRGLSDEANYGFEPRYAIGGNPNPKPYHSHAHIPFYKLHGSFNWLYCSKCQEIDIRLVNPKGQRLLPYDATTTSLGICPACQNNYEPVIITPTLLKDYVNPYLKRIWQKAKETLIQADKIVFVGYSLPDADKDLCDMFVAAIQLNRNINGTKPSITVVDYAINEPRPTSVEQRYTDKFGTVNYSPAGFLKYIEHL
jgi:NAD-dependent SIR2 family protein deacetylase